MLKPDTSMKRQRTLTKSLFSVLTLSALPFMASAVVVFEEDFNRTNRDLDGDNGWTAVDNTGLSSPSSEQHIINDSQGQLFRAASAGGSAATMFIQRDLNGTAGYVTTISNNTGVVSYGIQIKQAQFNPSGAFDFAYVIGATDPDFQNAGDGYFVGLEGNDNLFLGRYTGGISTNLTSGSSNITSVISTTFDFGFGGDGTLRAEYDPSSNEWSLFAADSDSEDPLTGVLTQQGVTTVDSTFTGSDLRYYGMVFDSQNAGADRFVTFDEMVIDVAAIPEPATALLLSLISAAFAIGRRRRS